MNDKSKPIAIININIKEHPDSMKMIASWLIKQVDYLVQHQTELSTNFTARLFYNEKEKIYHGKMSEKRRRVK